MKALFATFTISLALIACSIPLHAGPPKGWFVAGSRPADYESGIDASAFPDFRPSAYLRSTTPVISGFGTLMQQFSAGYYLGKRLRFTALVKTQDAQDWAGLWMRIDQGPKTLAFDNMQDRPIKGTSSWQRYSVVLDVPQNASGIFFGVLLSGSGQVWINDAQIEPVGSDVLPTGMRVYPLNDQPTNLDFRE